MQSSSKSRLVAAGLCACVVAALQWQPGPVATSLRSASNRAAHAEAPRPLRITRAPTTSQAQPIALDLGVARKAAREGDLPIVLPDGQRYALRIERQETDRFGAWSLIGHVRTPAGPQAAVLTFGNNAVFGTLPMPDGGVLQIATNHGEVVATLAGGMTPPGDVPAAPDTATVPVRRGATRPLVPMLAQASVRPRLAAMETATAQASAAPAPTPQAAMPSAAAQALPLVTVTILATYADDLVALRGSEAAVQTELSNLIAAANQSHIDSGSRVRLQLVGTAKLAIPSTWSNTDALYAMTVAPIDGVDTEVLRNTYSADLVTFVRPYADYENCGISWVAGTGLDGVVTDSLFAYSVVDREPCGPHVMAHETGHNLGAAHDRETETDNPTYELNFGAFTDSFGWRGWSGHEFADIMSYNTYGEPWLGVFSTPRLTNCNGDPCGVAGKADVVSTFDRMAQTVSEFRRTNGKGSVSDTELKRVWSAHQIMRFPIRLSVQRNTVASVDVQVVAGAEYVLEGSTPKHIEFQPFQQQANFDVQPYGTDLNGRQVTVKLTNPVGFTLEDDTAVGTITDVQPVPVLVKVALPDPWWGGKVTTSAAGANGPRFEGSNVSWTIPDSDLVQFDVAPGSTVQFDGTDDAGDWRVIPKLLQDVQAAQMVSLDVAHLLRITGKVLFQSGSTTYPYTLSGGDHLRYREIYKGRVLQDGTFQPEGFLRYALPGSTVEIIADIAQPSSTGLKSFIVRRIDVQQDLDLQMYLTKRDNAFVVGGRPVHEGPPGQQTIVPIGVQLTGPAPAGGATIVWQTVDGTAKSGSDYVAASGTLTFAAGEQFKQVGIVINGDAVAEPDEYFDVKLTQAQGVVLGSAPTTRVDILRDEARSGGPGQINVVAPQ